jgi:hypothetical protein
VMSAAAAAAAALAVGCQEASVKRSPHHQRTLSAANSSSSSLILPDSFGPVGWDVMVGGVWGQGTAAGPGSIMGLPTGPGSVMGMPSGPGSVTGAFPGSGSVMGVAVGGGGSSVESPSTILFKWLLRAIVLYEGYRYAQVGGWSALLPGGGGSGSGSTAVCCAGRCRSRVGCSVVVNRAQLQITGKSFSQCLLHFGSCFCYLAVPWAR